MARVNESKDTHTHTKHLHRYDFYVCIQISRSKSIKTRLRIENTIGYVAQHMFASDFLD